MKKWILFSLFALVSIKPIMASHLAGGELTVKWTSANVYLLELTLYRDVYGISMPSADILFVQNNLSGSSHYVNVEADTSLWGDTVPGTSAAHVFEVYRYFAYDTLPNDSVYSISFSNCCRNAAIVNISMPSSESLYLETTFSTFPGAIANSSPAFLAMPVVYWPLLTAWSYNPMAVDPDGDSLYWLLDVPMSMSGSPCPGYAHPTHFGSGAFTVDASNGIVSWTPGMAGVYVASVLVQEYRAGIKIGETRRDMEYITVPPSLDSIPLMDTFIVYGSDTISCFFDDTCLVVGSYVFCDSSVMDSAYTLRPEAGEDFSIYFSAYDDDLSDLVQIDFYGEVFDLGATIERTSDAGKAKAVFSWTPSPAHIRERPYRLLVRVSDGKICKDYTFSLEVVEKTIEEPSQFEGMEVSLNEYKVYPMPASSSLFLESVSLEPLEISLISLLGNSLLRMPSSGTSITAIPIDHIPSGMYLLQVKSDNHTSLIRVVVNN